MIVFTINLRFVAFNVREVLIGERIFGGNNGTGFVNRYMRKIAFDRRLKLAAAFGTGTEGFVRHAGILPKRIHEW